MAREEHEIQVAGGAVALLGDDEFGFGAIFFGQVGLVKIGAIDEEDYVGVLFDGARFAQIGELRLALFALGCARELAQHDYRNFQFLCETFQRARNAGNFFLAICSAAGIRGYDELQIIDDHEREAAIALEAARLRAHFEDGGGCGIVDPERRFAKARERARDFIPVVAAHVASAEFVRVDARFRSEQAQQQRFLRHFQAEDGDRLTIADSDVFGDVQRERGFSHRRTRGEDDKLGRLQAGGLIVEARVAGGEAGDAPAFAEDALEALEIVADEFFDADESGAHAIFGNLEDRGFGAIENHVGVVTGCERLFLDGGGGEGEIAEEGFFFDDARVVLDVRHARKAVSSCERYATPPADSKRPLRARSSISVTVSMACCSRQAGSCARKCGDAAGGKNPQTVALDRGVHGVIVEEDRAEDAALGFDVVRQRAFEEKCSR